MGRSRYNSVVYPEYAANDYSAHYVSENFVNGANETVLDPVAKSLHDNIASRVRLERAECIAAFEAEFVSTYRDVLVVLDYENATHPVLSNFKVTGGQNGASERWICTYIGFCGFRDGALSSLSTGDTSAAEDWKVVIIEPKMRGGVRNRSPVGVN